MVKFPIFLLFLTFLLPNSNASILTDLFQKIDNLEVYSSEGVIFDDEPPLRLQLKAFDSLENELDLNGVSVEWNIEESENSKKNKKDSESLLQTIPFCSSHSVYKSEKHIGLLERQGLRGNLILVKPVDVGTAIIRAQIKDNNETIEAKPFKLTVISNEEDKKCFKDVKGFDMVKAKLECSQLFYDHHQGNETSDLILRNYQTQSMEEDKRRQLSQFLRRCQRTKIYSYGVKYVDEERRLFLLIDFPISIASLSYAMFTMYFLCFSKIFTLSWAYPKYKDKVCFELNCHGCLKCSSGRWKSFGHCVVFPRNKMNFFNNMWVERFNEDMDKYNKDFPDTDPTQIDWSKVRFVATRNFLIVYIILTAIIFCLFMSFPGHSFPFLINEDCQY